MSYEVLDIIEDSIKISLESNDTLPAEFSVSIDPIAFDCLRSIMVDNVTKKHVSQDTKWFSIRLLGKKVVVQSDDIALGESIH